MPRVALHRGGRGVIAGDGKHVRLARQKNRERVVEILDRLDLGVEVAVFTGLVGVLVVDEEVVVVLVFLHVALELLRDGFRSLDLGHAHQLAQALVHRVHRQRRGLETIALFDGGDVGLVRHAAHQEAVRGLFLGEQRQGELVEVGDQLRDLLLAGALRIQRLGGRDGEAFAIGIGVGQRAFEAGAAEDDHEAVLLARVDEYLVGADLLDLRGEDVAEAFADLGGDASGAAVGDQALGIEGAEVGAGGDVAVLEFDPETECLDHPAADFPLDGVITEQREMAGAGARGDARSDGDHASLRASLRDEGVEVGSPGRLQRGHATLFAGGDVAETVEDHEGQLGAGFDLKLCVHVVEFAHKAGGGCGSRARRSIVHPGGPGYVLPRRARA